MTVSEKQDKKRRQIAKAVKEFFKDYNYENITVDDICNATGIAKGTFYHYFSGKDSLLNEIIYPIDDYFSSLEEDMMAGESFMEAIRQYAVYYTTYISTSGLNMCRTVILAMINSNNTEYVSNERGVKNILLKIIQHWQQKGEVTEAFSAQKICDMFMVMFRGYILNWYSCNGSYDLEESVVAHARILASGFLCMKHDMYAGNSNECPRKELPPKDCTSD